MKICLLLLSLCYLSLGKLSAQDALNAAEKEAAYNKTIHTRAEKIVTTLNISDSAKANNVINIIADQYRNLNILYNDRDDAVKLVKGKSEAKEVAEAEFKNIEESNLSFKSFVIAFSRPGDQSKRRNDVQCSVGNLQCIR